jgi:chitinase
MNHRKTFMTLEDEDGYNAALARAGLAPDWVVLRENEIDKDLTVPHIGRKYTYTFENYPIKNPDLVVPNPKDIVTKGLGSIPELRLSMQATYMEIAVGSYIGGSPMDAAEAFSTPVFLLMQAVENMAQAKALGAHEEEIEEDERKNFILLIISVFFLVRDGILLG